MDLIIATQNPDLQDFIKKALSHTKFHQVTKPPAQIYIIDFDALPISSGFINNSALFLLEVSQLPLLPASTSLPIDFMLKPLTADCIPELIFRLNKLSLVAPQPILKVNNLELNPSNHQVTFFKKQLTLSSTEFKILQLFMQNPQKTLSKAEIHHFCWPQRQNNSDNLIEVYIQKLRHKIHPHIINTVHGVGYKLEENLKVNHTNKETTNQTNPIKNITLEIKPYWHILPSVIK